MVEAYQRGEGTYEELAARFSVGVASVSRWLRRVRESGGVSPRAHAGGQRLLIQGADLIYLHQLVKAHPDWTEAELARELRTKRRVEVSDVTVGRAVRRLGYSVKKKRLSRPSESAPMSNGGVQNGALALAPSPLRVWFLWTKRARTSR